MRAARLSIALAIAGTPGCYLFNDLGGGVTTGLDARVIGADASPATVRDAPIDVWWPTPIDASSLSARDVWYPDSGPPLPREPEPDPGPDGRPSDDPDDWVDPPDVGGEDPCCTLGEPVRITSRVEGTSLAEEPPLIAWRPGRFALAVTRYFERREGDVFRTVIYEVDDEGTRMGEAILLDSPPRISADTRPDVRSLRWAAGRWALAATGDATLGSGREMYVRLFDNAWTPASTWLPLGGAIGVDLAYLPRGDGWLAFTSFPESMRTTPFDELNGVGRPVESPLEWSMSVRAASFRSRAAVVPISAESGPDFLVVDPEGTELGRVPREGHWIDAGGMAALRDLAVVAVRRDDQIEAEVLDPFTLTRVSEPHVIGAAGSSSDRALVRSVDVAGSSKFGVAGVCWGVPGSLDGRGGEDSQIMFGLVGPEGLPRGAAVTLVSSPFRGSMAACTVGTDDRGFLVGWWNGSELWVRRVDVAP